jgi:hypothetical protein
MSEMGHKVGVGWPSWRYPPDGGPGAIFQGPGEAPSGCLERPVRKRTAAELIAADAAPKMHFVKTPSGLSVPRGTRLQRPIPDTRVPEEPGGE